MSFIYAITNKVSGKQYIGKTNNKVDRRFREHLSDAKKTRCKNRPLYRAINKHGEDNFEIHVIEEIYCNDACDREVFWIDHFDTYKSGYNATKGADGKPYLDYDAIANTYTTFLNLKKTAEFHGCHRDSVVEILRIKGIAVYKNAATDAMKRAVIGEKDNISLLFESIKDAEDYLKNKCSSHISACCKGVRKTCNGFTWRYA